MNPEILVDAVLRSFLGGRRKKSKGALRYLTGKGGGSLLNTSTLLGAAGVAWGIYETLQGEAGGRRLGRQLRCPGRFLRHLLPPRPPPRGRTKPFGSSGWSSPPRTPTAS